MKPKHASAVKPILNDQRAPILLSWSGGKDAAWTLQLLKASKKFTVVGLLTTFNTVIDQAAGQGISYADIAKQAAALNLPLFEMWIPERASNDAYAAAFAEVISSTRKSIPSLQFIAFGDISLADLKAWRTQLCAEFGMTPLFPLFGIDSYRLASEMIQSGLKAKVSLVDESRLPVEFLGLEFNEAFLRKLPAGVDPCGENGEFQTQISLDSSLLVPYNEVDPT